MSKCSIGIWFKTTSEAVKQNIRPGIVLQLFGVSIVIAYYFLPSSRSVFDFIMDLKAKNGFVYSAISTALFGAVIPFVILFMLGRVRRNGMWLRMAMVLLFWTWKGIEVDLFYRFQTMLFGSNIQLETIIKKVVIDQFVYSPVWAAPLNAVYYLWLDYGCSFRKLFHRIDKKFFVLTLPTMIISTWVVWIPSVAIIYTLPQQLQIPIFNLVLCFWVLILDLVIKPPVDATGRIC